jgi:hypothetical protein
MEHDVVIKQESTREKREAGATSTEDNTMWTSLGLRTLRLNSKFSLYQFGSSRTTLELEGSRPGCSPRPTPQVWPPLAPSHIEGSP